jgi:hypothetical protein
MMMTRRMQQEKCRKNVARVSPEILASFLQATHSSFRKDPPLEFYQTKTLREI